MDLRPYPETIVIVRHAESQGNLMSRDERAKTALGTNFYRLTPRGRAQTEITGAWLREYFPKPTRILRSHYTRTAETAEVCYPGEAIKTDPRLAEANRGVWHVLTEDEIRAQMPWELTRRELEGLYHYRPIGGESVPDVERRVIDFRSYLHRCYGGKVVVVFTHGQWINLWFKRHYDWSEDEFVDRYMRDDVVANASVTIFRGCFRSGGQCVLLHDPATDYIVPWHGKLDEVPTRSA